MNESEKAVDEILNDERSKFTGGFRDFVLNGDSDIPPRDGDWDGGDDDGDDWDSEHIDYTLMSVEKLKYMYALIYKLQRLQIHAASTILQVVPLILKNTPFGNLPLRERADIARRLIEEVHFGTDNGMVKPDEEDFDRAGGGRNGS